jgi:NAD(P)-dependent dehydrogenase (short-subunit alcohol dehydrogenase family)
MADERVAFVTGGAGTLGRAVTREFLEGGWRVAVATHHHDAGDALADLASAHGSRLFSFLLDLTTERGAGAAVARVLEWAGRLDSLVHAMGGYAGGERLHETPVEVWDEMMAVNLRSAWLVTRGALPPMLEGGGGTLVFVSARAALRGRAGHGAYAVAKAGLLTLVEALAEEYGGDGVRANAVLPGTIDTPANREAMPDADPARWTPPAEIARVVRFLASEESAPVNGAAVPVYGRS